MKAFPVEYKNPESGGMDLRDYFAAKAMQALLEDDHNCSKWLSKKAYEYADAMMKAREEK
jgi:hypothetical protein